MMNRTFLNPFNELETLSRDVARLLGLPAEESAGATRPFFASPPASGSAPYPRLNITETEQAYEIEAPLPGIDPAALDLQVQAKELIIAGEKPAADHTKDESRRVFVSERGFGKFRRQIKFGAEINPAEVSARYELGILTVRLGKAEQAKPQSIPIDVVA